MKKLMTLLALLAGATLWASPQDTNANVLVVGDQNIPLRFPDPVAAPDPAPVLRWSGWKLGPGELKFDGSAYEAPADWGELGRRALGTDASPSAPWQGRFFVFSRVDLLDRGTDGFLRPRRFVLDDASLQATLEAINRHASLLRIASGGKLAMKATVTIEREPFRGRIGAKGMPSAVEGLKPYLEARINGGGYVADDKVERGPFQGVVVLVPSGTLVGNETQSLEVNGMDVQVVSVPPVVVPGLVERRLESAWAKSADRWAQHLGYRIAPDAAPLPWEALAERKAPTENQWIERQSLPASLPKGEITPKTTQWIAVGWEASVATDPERGSILKITEKSDRRGGGFELPVDAATGRLPGAGMTLELVVRTRSTESIAIWGEEKSGKSARFSLGRDAVAPAGQRVAESTAVPLTPDGTWQTVRLDFSKLGLNELDRVYIMASPAAKIAERQTLFPIVTEFAEIRRTSEPAELNPLPPDPDLVSAERAREIGKLGGPASELIPLIQSPSDVVALAALESAARVISPELLNPLDSATNSLNSRRAELAVEALAAQGDEPSITALRRRLRIASTDYVKGIVARSLSQRPPANFQADLTLLVTNRSWQTRIEAVEALGRLAGKEAGIIAMSFLAQDDPQLKLVTTRLADPNEDFEMRRVLWSSVNEPWDAVRAESCIRLIQSPLANYREEGLKGVRDDSAMVRIRVLNWLGTIGKPEYRAAILLGLNDINPEVRAAALLALRSQPDPVTLDELRPVLKSRYPAILSALKMIAEGNGLTLPPTGDGG